MSTTRARAPYPQLQREIRGLLTDCGRWPWPSTCRARARRLGLGVYRIVSAGGSVERLEVVREWRPGCPAGTIVLEGRHGS